MNRNNITTAKRIVIKIGTSTVTNEGGSPNDDFINHLAYQVDRMINQGKEIVIVSSGAIRTGHQLIENEFGRKSTAVRSQRGIPSRAYRSAASALGQTRLMSHFRDAFQNYGRLAPLILLTRPDVLNRFPKNYFYHIDDFLRAGLVPIVNENDAVTNGAAFGGNDNLAVLVAGRISSDLIILLSDVGGFYTSDPNLDPSAELIPQICERIPSEMYNAAKSSSTDSGSGGIGLGGMRAKLRAAEIALDFGIPFVIASGQQRDILLDIIDGRPLGTLVSPRESKRMRRGWRAHILRAEGSITVDEGAQQAVEEGDRSLLAAGIIRVEGSFETGDCIALTNGESGFCFAKGLVNYSSSDLNDMLGGSSPRASGSTNGVSHALPKEVIHRDDIVFTQFFS